MTIHARFNMVWWRDISKTWGTYVLILDSRPDICPYDFVIPNRFTASITETLSILLSYAFKSPIPGRFWPRRIPAFFYFLRLVHLRSFIYRSFEVQCSLPWKQQRLCFLGLVQDAYNIHISHTGYCNNSIKIHRDNPRLTNFSRQQKFWRTNKHAWRPCPVQLIIPFVSNGASQFHWRYKRVFIVQMFPTSHRTISDNQISYNEGNDCLTY